MQACGEDEICAAMQDVIIAIDASGSLTEDGFTTLKTFASTLVEKYKSKYYGDPAARVGVIQFGNGQLLDDGSISPALNVRPLSEDLAAVKTAVDGLSVQKGFTNLAQAFTLAKTMFSLGAREGAQSILLVITDGTPSNNYATLQQAERLEDAGIHRYFVLVADQKGKDYEVLKRFSSHPHSSSLLYVPGLAALDTNQDVWTEKAVVKFCPASVSPSLQRQADEARGYQLVASHSKCGADGELVGTAESPDTCAEMVKDLNILAFRYGVGYQQGKCIAVDLEVTDAVYQQWEDEKVDPPCPFSDTGLEYDCSYDFYAIAPAGYQR